MGGTGVATLVRTGVTEKASAGQHKPLGLGNSSLPHQPLGVCPRGPRNLLRQWTTAKPRGDVSCNVLPFFLDLSLAFAPGMEFFDAVKSSVDSEVVFQATLQVPAHHALACRVNAYGTPFAAPDLQAAAHELRDEDLEFAACLATPPDLDEQLSVNFGRVMSLLERNQGQDGGQIATRAAQARAEPGGSAGGGAMQQIRSTPGATQQAPKVLVSVDEAETTMAQLHRQNSGKKQRFSALMDGYGKRAVQALLGLGYLLTVLHEKSLGGRIEFSAALTAASIISPSTSDNHVKPRGSGGFGVLAGLRQLMRECPSLSPMSTPSHSIGRRHTSVGAAAAAAAVAATLDRVNSYNSSRSSVAGDSFSPRRQPQTAASFEAAWERVLHPPLSSSGGGGGSGSFGSRAGAARSTQVPACQGLQLQLSLSAPCRVRSTSLDGSATPGSTPRTPVATQQQAHSNGYLAAGGASGASAPAAPATYRGSPLAKSSGGVLQANWRLQQELQQQGASQQQQQQQQQEEDDEHVLHKTCDYGRAGMEAIIDDAIEQLQQRAEPSATDLVALVDAGESVFAAAAAAAATGEGDATNTFAPCTPVRSTGLEQQEQEQQQQEPQTPGSGVRSFYLVDQGPLTSPLSAAWPPPSPASAGGKAPTPFGSPWVNIHAAAATRDSSAGGASSSSNVPGTPQRMLLPVMSMRLTCQPAWQYSNNGGEGGADSKGRVPNSRDTATAPQADMTSNNTAAADTQSPSLTLSQFISAADADSSRGPSNRPAVHMHQLTKEQQQELQKHRQHLHDRVLPGEEAYSGDSALLGSPTSMALPQGLWPTMSFSLVPVRLPPASPKSGFRSAGASCPA